MKLAKQTPPYTQDSRQAQKTSLRAVFASLTLILAVSALFFAANPADAQDPPRVQTVTPSNVTLTTARITVGLDKTPAANTSIFYRYRPNTQVGWSASDQSSYNTSLQNSTFDLTGLTAAVTYDVEVSLQASYANAVAIEFTTRSVESVELRSVGPTIMEVLVSIRHPGSASNTVRLRYRATGAPSWTSVPGLVFSGANGSTRIASLTAGTEYEIEASLDSGFPSPGTETDTHTHLGTRLIYFDVVDHTSRQITNVAAISANDASIGTLPSSYEQPLAATEMDGWFYIVQRYTNHLWRTRTPLTVNSYTDLGEIGSSLAKIDGLAGKDGVLYAISLDLMYRIPDPTDPSNGVTAIGLPQAVADLNAWCVSCGATNVGGTVYFVQSTNIYRVSNLASPSTATRVAVSGLPGGFAPRALVEFNGRMFVNDEGEEDLYEITGFSSGTTASAVKIGDYNGLSSNVTAMVGWSGNPAAIASQVTVAAEDTTATATVTSTKADSSGQTFYVRWRVGNTGDWSDANASGTGTTQTVSITGLTAETTYNVQASLDENFPADDRATSTFTTTAGPTLGADPITFAALDYDSVTINVVITNAGGASGTLYGRYGVNGSNSWTNLTAQNFSGTSASWDIDSLNGGTTYAVQVSLNNTWTGNNFRQNTFTTEATPDIALNPEPGNIHRDSSYSFTVTGTNVMSGNISVTQTGTVITIADSAASLDCSSPTTSLTDVLTVHVRGCTNGSATLTVTDNDDSNISQDYSISVANHPGAVESIAFSSYTTNGVTATVALTNPHSSSVTLYARVRRVSDDVVVYNVTQATATGTSHVYNLIALAPGTTYELQVSTASDYSTAHTVSAEFTTTGSISLSPVPSTGTVDDEVEYTIVKTDTVTSVSLTNAEETGALSISFTQAGLNCSNTDGTIINSTTHTTVWIKYCEAGHASVTIYDANNQSTVSTLYQLTLKDPGVESIAIDQIDEDSARITVTLDNPGAETVDYDIRYRTPPDTGTWGGDISNSTTGESETHTISGLTDNTEYEVGIGVGSIGDSFLADDNFATSTLADTATFTTHGTVAASPEPSATYPRLSNNSFTIDASSIVTQVQATITAGTGDATLSGSEATLSCTSIDRDETYAVTATIHVRWCSQGTVTLRLEDTSDSTVYAEYSITVEAATATVTSLDITQVMESSARGTATVSNPDSVSATVTFSIRPTSGTYTESGTTDTSGTSAVFDYSSLNSNTAYEAQACIGTSCATDTFTTPAAMISLTMVESSDVTSNSATVTVTISNGDSQSVQIYIRHHTTPVGTTWQSHTPMTITGTSATFSITGLTRNTEYRVQASIGDTFSTTVQTDFTTEVPEVDDVTVASRTRTSITLTVDIANSDGLSQTFYERHRTPADSGAWSTTSSFTSAASSHSLTLSGLTENTEYRVEVSTDNTFPAGELTGNVEFVTTPNTAPAFASATATREVYENALAGQVVGTPVTATDADGDSLVYSISGTDAATFNVGSSDGQITVSTGVTIDYETKTSYSVVITARDTHAATDIIDVTIEVLDLREAGLLGTIVFTVGHGSPYGYVSGSYGTIDTGDFPGDLFGDGNDRDVAEIYEDDDGFWYWTYSGGLADDWSTSTEELSEISVKVIYEGDVDERSFVLGDFIDSYPGNRGLKLDPPLPSRDWEARDTEEITIEFSRAATQVLPTTPAAVDEPTVRPGSFIEFLRETTPGGPVTFQMLLTILVYAGFLYQTPSTPRGILMAAIVLIATPIVPVFVGLGDWIAASINFVNIVAGGFAYNHFVRQE